MTFREDTDQIDEDYEPHLACWKCVARLLLIIGQDRESLGEVMYRFDFDSLPPLVPSKKWNDFYEDHKRITVIMSDTEYGMWRFAQPFSYLIPQGCCSICDEEPARHIIIDHVDWEKRYAEELSTVVE